MYITGKFEERYDIGYEPPVELDPICNMSELAAHQVKRMPVYPDDLPSKVDVVGYVEPNKRIKQMIDAGIRIDAWNHAVYDFENEEDDDGVSMPSERSDIDELESLSEGKRSADRYYDDMYRMYLRALRAEAAAGDGEPGDKGVQAPSGEHVVDGDSAKGDDLGKSR